MAIFAPRSHPWIPARAPVRLLLLGVALAVAAGAAYVAIAGNPFNRAPQVPAYQTTVLSRGPLRLTVRATGPISNPQSVPLSFKSSGTLTEIDVGVGQAVNTGHVVARQDTTDLQLSVRQAQANLDSQLANQSKIAAGSTPQQVAAAQAQVNGAQISLDNAQRALDSTRASGSATIAGSQSDVAAAQVSFGSAQMTLARYTNPDGRVTHSGMPYLGASLSDINRPATLPGVSSRRLQPPPPPAGVDHGALVDPSGPSAQAGVQPGDVITGFGGIDVYNPDELLERLVLHAPGDQVVLGMVRNGQPLTFTLIVGEAPVQ